MKTTLNFDLYDADDSRLYKITNKAEDMLYSINDIMELSSKLKHETNINWDTFDRIINEIMEILKSYDITEKFLQENG